MGTIVVLGWGSMEVALAFRDPTEPQMLQKKGTIVVVKKEVLIVSAIMIAGDRRNAVVNNVMVKEGDKVANVSIEKIEPYSVTVVDKGKKTILYLLGEGSVKETMK